MLWMMDIFRKFTLLGGLVVDCCAGIFLVAKTCMILPQHRLFVGSNLDSQRSVMNLLQLALHFRIKC